MCEFFNDNLTAILITFIGAFFAFILASIFTLFIEHWKRSSDKRKEKKNILQLRANQIEYFLILLDEVIHKSEKQIQLINEYILTQEKNLLDPIQLSHIPMENLFFRLKTFEGQGIFESLSNLFYLDKDWIKNYNTINSSLDYLEAEFCEELIRINRETLKKAYEKLLIVRDLIDEIPNILAKEAFVKEQQLGKNRNTDEEFNFIDTTIGKFHELLKKDAGLNEYNISILTPLLEKDIKPYRHNPYALDIIFNSKKARVLSNDVKKDINETIAVYKIIIQDFERPINDLKELVNVIKKKHKSTL
jgi:hypothetical protein